MLFMSKRIDGTRGLCHLPLLCTTSIGAAHVEVIRLLEKKFPLGMLPALDREPIMDVIVVLHELEEGFPSIFPFLAIHVGLHVPKHDNAIARSRKKNVEPLRCHKESNISMCVASGQRYNDNVGLFPLVIVYTSQLRSIPRRASGTHRWWIS